MYLCCVHALVPVPDVPALNGLMFPAHDGFQACSPGATLVAIHDSARPLVKEADVQRCLQDALEVQSKLKPP